jgi:hypothetical protein
MKSKWTISLFPGEFQGNSVFSSISRKVKEEKPLCKSNVFGVSESTNEISVEVMRSSKDVARGIDLI